MLQRGPFQKECAKHERLSHLEFQPATSTGSRVLQHIVEYMWRQEPQKNKSYVTSISR